MTRSFALLSRGTLPTYASDASDEGSRRGSAVRRRPFPMTSNWNENRMIKSELIRIVMLRHPHLYQQDVEHIVTTILGDIANALANGDRVELRGFGTFSVRHRPSRSGRFSSPLAAQQNNRHPQ